MLNFNSPVETDLTGRIKVTSNLTLPDHPHVFVIGDLACIKSTDGTIVPGLAPAAIQEGKYVARSILSSIAEKPKLPFHYFDKGQTATIGRHRAVLESGKLKMTGFPAWSAWLFIHIFYLVGFKNRTSVMSQWVWNYVFSKRGSRLITDPNWQTTD